MKPLTEREIRASFVNCTKGEAKRLNIPRDLDERPWEDLDFLGWRDPQAPDRTYLVAELEGTLRGVQMRCPGHTVGSAQRSMCSLCLTTHSGNVSLMVAPRAGRAGKEGNSVGAYICADLRCSLHLRGRTDTGTRTRETLTEEEKIARTMANLAAFLAKVQRP